MLKVLGGNRQAAVCREMTKRFEEITRGSLAELAEIFGSKDVKGEIVVVVDRGAALVVDEETVKDALKTALNSHSVRDASAIVAEELGLPRRDVYQMALAMGKRA